MGRSASGVQQDESQGVSRALWQFAQQLPLVGEECLVAKAGQQGRTVALSAFDAKAEPQGENPDQTQLGRIEVAR